MEAETTSIEEVNSSHQDGDVVDRKQLRDQVFLMVKNKKTFRGGRIMLKKAA